MTLLGVVLRFVILGRIMKRVPFLLGSIAFAIVVSVKPAWCLDINPEDASGSAGSTVVIPIILSVPTEGFDLQTFGFTFNFDPDVLSFDSADRTGTLTHPFDLFSAQLIAPGQVEVMGSMVGSPVHVSSPGGVLVKIVTVVNDHAFKNSSLTLTDLTGDISSATIKDGTFTVTGVSPPSCIKGYVRDAVTGSAIVNAVVTVHNDSLSLDHDTQPDGSYFGYAPLGMWHVTVSAASYESETRSDVSLTEMGCSTENFLLHRTIDLTGDDQTDLSDIILILQMLAGRSSCPTACQDADFNGDKRIGWEEVIYILRWLSEV